MLNQALAALYVMEAAEQGEAFNHLPLWTTTAYLHFVSRNNDINVAAHCLRNIRHGDSEVPISDPSPHPQQSNDYDEGAATSTSTLTVDW